MIPTVALICWSLFVIEEVGHVIEVSSHAHAYTTNSGGRIAPTVVGFFACVPEDIHFMITYCLFPYLFSTQRDASVCSMHTHTCGESWEPVYAKDMHR